MNRAPALLGHVVACLLLALALLAYGQPIRATTLAEAWFDRLAEAPSPPDWAYSVALRKTDIAVFDKHRDATLLALDNLSEREPAPWQQQWRTALATQATAEAIRSPGRFDLPYMLADLRRNVALGALQHFGVCEAPPWVEIWSSAGVVRVPWHSGATSHSLLKAQPRKALSDVDRVVVIDPMGKVTNAGQAAWNWQPIAVSPGSRLVVVARGSRTMRADLEYLADSTSRFLAMQMPGDDCRLERQ
ncbi:capsule biosynthesis GfcC family protein [Halomonas sp. E19]|uniref:capsule biosynthesis GfcC family protein n=1 Tax=Halomonas sp. E19 TaxID=3397247 RepID=UPI004034F382